MIAKIALGLRCRLGAQGGQGNRMLAENGQRLDGFNGQKNLHQRKSDHLCDRAGRFLSRSPNEMDKVGKSSQARAGLKAIRF